MKWVAGVAMLLCYGILEGSDAQGYEITSAMWVLLAMTMVMAGAVLLKGGNHE